MVVLVRFVPESKNGPKDDGNMSREHRSRCEGVPPGLTWDNWGLSVNKNKSLL